MKACPWCAEEIQDAAVVCRFCHNDVDTEDGNEEEFWEGADHEDYMVAAEEFSRNHLDRPALKFGSLAAAVSFFYFLYELPQGYQYDSFLQLSLWAGVGAVGVFLMIWFAKKCFIWLVT
jgi:hypothetical protein